ncbi:MAG: TerC family protein [Planctomycetes bacterium]|nr:TerC family protein [Planctomycetota bacterium]
MLLIASIGSPALWGGFLLFVLLMVALDLGVFHKQAHQVSLREAAGWSLVWVSLAGVFNLGVWWWFGPERALEFTAGYVIEKALSVDNIFVFVVIFGALRIPAALQHRVLIWGIIGALVLRALFIGLGTALISRFHWAIYVFGGILLITGIKLFFAGSEEPHPEKNPLVRLFRRIVPSTPMLHGQNFFVRENGRLVSTPLLMALVTIEATDVVFAVDSIPAIFAVTLDPFIVFTSNIFAILGLRALYFLLAGIIDRFHYLKYGLAFVLLFVGAKMVASDWVKVPILVSLTVIAVLLSGSIVASLLRPRAEPEPPAAPPGPPAGVP